MGAIEIAENVLNDHQAGGCSGADPNPYYHTGNDTIATNMTPSYAFSIAQAALATISAMAIPIDACFASAPAITATGNVSRVDLAWSSVPGAAKYRIYRSADGCGGSFVSVGETAATSFTDPVTTAASFSYTIEAVSADGLASRGEQLRRCHADPLPRVATSSTYLTLRRGPGSGTGSSSRARP